MRCIGNYAYYPDPIGVGSFSVVYRGYQMDTKMPVAVKHIRSEMDRKYLSNETFLMKRLDHPNILKLFDTVQIHKEHYLILEYCNGGHLAQYIQSKKSEHDDHYFKQILAGLQYLYEQKVLHRDIKPHNILVHNQQIKIADFGFSKSIDAMTLFSTCCGSPMYMAPEMVCSKKYTDKCDVWSIGVILYELLIKKHPYPVKSTGELLQVHQHMFPIDYSMVPHPNYVSLLKSMLHHNPEQRISFPDLFAELASFHLKSNPIDIRNKKRLPPSPQLLSQKAIYISPSFSSQSPNLSSSYSSLDSYSFRSDSSPNMSISMTDSTDSVIRRHEDGSEVFARSAPNDLSKLVRSSYFDDLSKQTEDQYHLVGMKPKLRSNSFSDVMEKSLKTIRHWIPNSMK